MSINPLIPYLPAFASFFIYGYLTGFFFLAWKRAHWGIILGYLFWIVYLAWCLFVFPLTEVQESYLQKWFYAGLIFAFIRPILTSSFAEHFKEDMSHLVYMVRRTWNVLAGFLPNKQPASNQQTHQSQKSQQTNHRYNQYNDTTEQARRAEQARREAEARARRAEKEKENQQSRAEDSKPEPPTADTRTPEEILGLKAGWTQEDLIKTYKSEAQRTHPDKWIGKPQAVRHAMEEEFKNIRQAFDQLKT